jgi:hypothetical protein
MSRRPFFFSLQFFAGVLVGLNGGSGSPDLCHA